jgi:hypothetical protein
MKKIIEESVSISLNKPENLVLEDLISPELPFFPSIRRDDGTSGHKMTTGKHIRKHIPSMYYFIHKLLERQHSDVDTLRCWFDKEYVEMFSRDIEPFKSKNDFRFVWGILASIKVIEFHDDTRPNKYRKSAKVYFFKLTDKYINSQVVQHEMLVRKTIADKLNKKWSNIKKQANDPCEQMSISTDKVYVHQYKALQNLKFDAENAKQHIDDLLEAKSIDIKRYNTCMININNLKCGKIKLKNSEVCKRFFTPVTSMPKELRQFIKDSEDNSLVELDFVSSQPFIVYKILNEMIPEFNSNIEKIAYENELDLYRQILSSGDFYRDFKAYFFPDEDLTRDQIKDEVLHHWFNGKLNSRNKFRKKMLQRLPSLSAIIDSMKSPRYKDFSNFAMVMESQLVNDIIYKKFIDIHPDVIMYTIFDSFLVERRYSTELLSMMQEEGSKYFTLNCNVRVK